MILEQFALRDRIEIHPVSPLTVFTYLSVEPSCTVLIFLNHDSKKFTLSIVSYLPPSDVPETVVFKCELHSPFTTYRLDEVLNENAELRAEVGELRNQVARLTAALAQYGLQRLLEDKPDEQ